LWKKFRANQDEQNQSVSDSQISPLFVLFLDAVA